MAEWIDTAIVLMHRHKIGQSELADKYGCRREYINRVLNGKEKAPEGASERILSAINEIIQSRTQ